MMCRLFSLVLLLGLAGTRALAQDAGAIQVKFAAQQVPRGLGKVLMVTGDASSEPFALPVNNLSAPQAVPGRAFLLQTEDGGKTLAKVTLPAKGADFIVLLVLQDPPIYTPVILAARDAKFKPGDVYLHNTSKKAIIGQVGTTKFGVPPGRGTVVTPAGAREERFYDVLLGYRDEAGTHVLSTSRWPVDERTRSYLFFFDDPARKSVDFRAIDEFVPVEKP